MAGFCWALGLDTALGYAMTLVSHDRAGKHLQDGDAEAESLVHGVIELEADRAICPARMTVSSDKQHNLRSSGVPAKQ